MAQNLDFVLRLQADLTGAQKFVKAQEQLKKVVEASGQTFDTNSRILKQNFEQIKINGVGYTRLTTQYAQANGVIKTTTAILNSQGNIAKGLANPIRTVTQNIGAMSASSRTLGQNLAALAGRAILTIPIWLALRGAILGVLGAFTGIFQHAREFELQLANVRIAGNATVSEIEKLGKGVLDLGTRFGTSFEEMGDAMVLWAQQGKSVNEILSLMAPTMQLAILSGRSMKDVVEDLTAVMTAYKIEAADAQRIVDALSKVNLEHAIDANNLAQALRTVSPVTAQFNISLEETLGLITAIQVQTRKGGATVGNAIRTILTRLNSGSAGAIQAIAKIPAFLDDVGNATFQTTDAMRPFGDLLADLAGRWDTLTTTQKNQLGVTIAGRQRVTEFLALMGNWEESVKATANAFFSAGAAMERTGVITETLDGRIKRLNNTFREVADGLRPAALGLSNFGVAAVNQFLEGIQELTQSKEQLKQREISGALAKENEHLQTQRTALLNLIDLFKHLDENKKRIQDRISRNTGPDGAVLDTDEQKAIENESLVLFNSFSSKTRELFAQLRMSDLVATDFFDLSDKVGNSLEEAFTRIKNIEAVSSLNEVRKQMADINTQIEAVKDSSKLLSAGGVIGSAARFFDRGAAQAKINQLEAEAVKLAEQEEKLTAQIQKDREKIKETVKAEVDLAKNRDVRIQKELSLARIMEKINELEEDSLVKGRSNLAIKKEQLALLLKLAEENGLLNQETGQIITPEGEKTRKKLTNAISTEENKNAQAIREAEFNLELQKGIALGETQVQQQVRRVQYAEELARIEGDNTKLILEQIKLREIMLKQIADTSSKLKSSVSEALQGALKGETDFAGTVEAIGSAFEDRITEAISNAFTDSLFQQTGLGEIFGGVTFEIENAHLKGVQQAAPLITQSIINGFQAGASGATSVPQTGINTGDAQGGASGLTGVGGLLSLRNPGANSLLAGGLFGALGGLSRGNTTQALFGGLSAAASLVNPILGLGVGLLGSLFGKKKSVTTTQERETSQQIASRIDTTNKELKFVNRNLVALRAAFETFALPDSAYFATKRGLEDQFSLNARRGLI